MPREESVSSRFWGVTPGIGRAARAVGLLFVLVALFLTAVGIAPLGAVMVWLLCLLVLVLVWRCYLMPYVELAGDRVVVQGPFDKREVRYDDIRGVQAGMHALRIETVSQGQVIAWAVQKSQVAEWAQRRTRADEVLEQIEARLPQPAVAAAPARRTR